MTYVDDSNGYGVPGSQRSQEEAARSSPSYSQTEQRSNGNWYGLNTVTGQWEQISHKTPQERGESQYANTPSGGYDFNPPTGGVRIYNPETGISEPGAKQDGGYVPESKVTKITPSSQTVQPQVIKTSYDVAPFKISSFIGYKNVPAGYGGRQYGGQEPVYGDVWVLPPSTPIVYEPGATGYEEAWTPTGKSLKTIGGYDPYRGVFIIATPREGGVTTSKTLNEALGVSEEAYTKGIPGFTGGQNIRPPSNIVDVIMPRAEASSVVDTRMPLVGGGEPSSYTPPSVSKDIFGQSENALFYFDPGHAFTKMQWGGKTVTVDTLSKGLFDWGAGLMGGAEIVSNILPEGPARSIGGGVIKTIVGVPAGLIMAPAAGSMLSEITVQQPQTTIDVLKGTPQFMAESKIQEYAKDPLQAITSDVLTIGMIGYGGIKLSGGKIPGVGEVSKTLKIQDFGKYLYSDTSGQLGGPLPRTILEPPKQSKVPAIDLTGVEPPRTEVVTDYKPSIDVTPTIDLTGVEPPRTEVVTDYNPLQTESILGKQTESGYTMRFNINELPPSRLQTSRARINAMDLNYNIGQRLVVRGSKLYVIPSTVQVNTQLPGVSQKWGQISDYKKMYDTGQQNIGITTPGPKLITWNRVSTPEISIPNINNIIAPTTITPQTIKTQTKTTTQNTLKSLYIPSITTIKTPNTKNIFKDISTGSSGSQNTRGLNKIFKTGRVYKNPLRTGLGTTLPSINIMGTSNKIIGKKKSGKTKSKKAKKR